MKHKLQLILLMGLVMMTLTGCHITHEWQEATCTTPRTCLKGGETDGEPLGHKWIEATCTEPKTCSICGETEGQALGHTWVEATCTEPKTCSVCNETEGEALGHTLTKANYQQAAVCQVCGESVGEPLQADFEKYGFSITEAELDVAYPYITQCYRNPDFTTVGSVTFSDYEVFTSDNDHEAVDGCEWRAVTITFRFDDENAREYGYTWNYKRYNYYDMSDHWTINYNGIDYPDCKFYDFNVVSQGWENHIATVVIHQCALVPTGYDGAMLTTYHTKYRSLGDDSSVTNLEKIKTFLEDENAISFRMK